MALTKAEELCVIADRIKAMREMIRPEYGGSLDNWVRIEGDLRAIAANQFTNQQRVAQPSDDYLAMDPEFRRAISDD